MKRKTRRSQAKRLLKQNKSIERIKTEVAVKEANRRMNVIERRYKGGNYTWGITKLKNIIPEFFNKKGRLEIPKNAKYTDLMNIYKETSKFLKSKVSTLKGLQDIKSRTFQTLKENLSDFEEDKFNDEDVTAYYKMFEDDDFTGFLRQTGLKASDVWAIIDDAIQNEDTIKSFKDRVAIYTNIQDKDIKVLAYKLYNKYVK